jgi:hypothetical protein
MELLASTGNLQLLLIDIMIETTIIDHNNFIIALAVHYDWRRRRRRRVGDSR